MKIIRGAGFPVVDIRASHLVRAIALVTFSSIGSLALFAATISGTVKDPSGAVISGAHIEITGGSLNQPVVLSSEDRKAHV